MKIYIQGAKDLGPLLSLVVLIGLRAPGSAVIQQSTSARKFSLSAWVSVVRYRYLHRNSYEKSFFIFLKIDNFRS